MLARRLECRGDPLPLPLLRGHYYTPPAGPNPSQTPTRPGYPMTTLQLPHHPRSFLSYLDPFAMLRSLWSHRELTTQLASRNISVHYKGQALGALWSLLDPLMLLAIYTFVFGLVFHRSGKFNAEGGIAGFALHLFAGIIVFGMFRETVGPSPMLIINQRNFVKKVVYPLETLPISQLLASLFNVGVGLVVWVIGYVIFIDSHTPSPMLLMLPIVILPVALLALGCSWILASLGVFLRDLRNPVGSVIQMLFFMSAIFYDIGDVPAKFRPLIALNPLAQLIQACRDVMFGHQMPRWDVWGMILAFSIVLCVVGYAFFMKSRRAFADVI